MVLDCWYFIRSAHHNSGFKRLLKCYAFIVRNWYIVLSTANGVISWLFDLLQVLSKSNWVSAFARKGVLLWDVALQKDEAWQYEKSGVKAIILWKISWCTGGSFLLFLSLFVNYHCQNSLWAQVCGVFSSVIWKCYTVKSALLLGKG